MSPTRSFWISCAASLWSMSVYLLGVAAGRRAQKRENQ